METEKKITQQTLLQKLVFTLEELVVLDTLATSDSGDTLCAWNAVEAAKEQHRLAKSKHTSLFTDLKMCR